MSSRLYLVGSGSVSSLGGDASAVAASYRAGEAASLMVPRSVRGTLIQTAPLSESAQQVVDKRCRAIPFLAERDRVVQLAASAALDAIGAARAKGVALEERRVAVVCGSARGATASLEAEHARSLSSEGVSVVASPSTTAGIIASTVAQACGFSGLSIDTSMTCTSGLHALLVARALITAGEVDAAVVVGSEAALTPFTLEQVLALRISPRVELGDPYPCRPFSAEEPPRSRMVLGEGAAAVVVVGGRPSDSFGSTRSIIKSFGFAAESPPSLTGIGGEGENFQEAMRRAFVAAACTPRDIDAVICHAPGTIKGDRAEWHALRAVFGELLPPLFSTKWLTGHTYGASGLLSVELAQFLRGGLTPAVPRYAGYGLSDTEITSTPKTVLINAAGFGGNALSLIITSDD